MRSAERVMRSLPDWPRGMPAWMAAEYIGVSPGMLRTLEDGQQIAATWVSNGRKVYLREELDLFLDRKAGRIKHSASSARMESIAEWDAACGDAGGTPLP